MYEAPLKLIPFAVFLSVFSSAGFSQSLTLSSGSGAPGSTVTLNLAVSSPAGAEPAALQWTFSYPSTSVAGIHVSGGSASTAAGKTVACSGGAAAYRCIAYGVNSTNIQNGAVAAVAVTLSSTATTATIGVNNVIGASASGASLLFSGAAGAVSTGSVSTASGPLVTGLQCTPTSIAANTSASCTVTLSQAAPSGGLVVSLTDNASPLSVPGSVTVAANASSASFIVTAGLVSSTQTATVTASLNGSSQSTTISLIAGATVKDLQCTPSTLSPGASSTCAVTLTQAAPAGGSVITLTDNSPALTVPASVTVPAGAASVSFPATTAAFSTSQTATISAALSSSATTGQVTTTLTLKVPVTVAPGTLLLLNGDATEVSGVANGATVLPAFAPTGLRGKVVVNGTGSVQFVSGKGVYFLACCSNSNNALYRFTGTALGDIFGGPQGQISFTLTSRYSFAQRQANAASVRYAFDARDANGTHQFTFGTQVISSGTLVFTYVVAGTSMYYYVPKGTEDQLFGSGVSLNVAIRWSGSTATLLLNGQAVKSTPYVPAASNWNLSSIFDFGGYEYQSFGGYDSLEDIIGQFTVSTPALIYLHGDNTEITTLSNGSGLKPAHVPSGVTGTLAVNGTGSVHFVTGKGVYFLACCSNSNNAYYHFTGAALGSAFGLSQGQITFTLTSRYSFAQRQANAASIRYAFDARDANTNHKFAFGTQIGTSGALMFNYVVAGVPMYYIVPKGTEDSLFGSGVSLDVSIVWTGSTATLLLNGHAVKSSTYTPVAANWTTGSTFDLGGYEYQASGGSDSLDDLIREFMVSGASQTVTAAVKTASSLALESAAPRPVLPASAAPSLSCAPTSLTAGSRAVCSLELGAASLADSVGVSLASSSGHLQLPAIISKPAGQTTVRFEVSAAEDAPEGAAVFEADAGDASFQETLTIAPADAPQPDSPEPQAGIAAATPAARGGVPEILTVGDGNQALAVHPETARLAAIPSARFDGEPARPGDVLLISIAGVDCSQPAATGNLRVRFENAVMPVLFAQPADDSYPACRIAVRLPGSGTGPWKRVALEVAQPDGSMLTSNVAEIGVEN